MPYTIRKSDDKFCVFKTGTDEQMGCHDSRAEAGAQVRALYANEADGAAFEFNLGIVEAVVDHLKTAMASQELGDSRNHIEAALEVLGELAAKKLEGPDHGPEVDIPGMPGSMMAAGKMEEFAWEGPIVFEGVPTGDGRVFKHGSITWDQETLPWPFRWQKASIKGHDGAVAIGRVDKLERQEDGAIYGYGVIIPSLNEEAAEYLRLMEAGVASGVSVDGDSAEFDMMENADGTPRVEFSSMRLRSLTAVDIPAFNEARIDLDDGSETEEFKKNKKRKKKMSWAYNLVASAIPVKPKVEWFQDPTFDGPTPITVTEDGYVYGHLALFDTCHIGLPGCVTPPQGSSYKYFHTGEVETVEGDCVDVGHLTFNTGHASMSDSAKQAASHYDHTGTVAADVRAGEDQWGIWVVGALRPSLSDEDLRIFRAAPLSGDWRRIAGKLELVGALAVNVPGFPVPRVRSLVSSGETETLLTFQDTLLEQVEDTEEVRIAKRSRIKAKIRSI